MSKRTIIIGDVHGCIDEMTELVAKAGYRPGIDQLIFVGDLINRGPDSLAVWKLYRELGATSVLGNHELHLIRDAKGIDVHKKWIKDFKVQFGGLFEDYLKDIQSWPLYIENEDFMVVHGGLVPGEHPSQSDERMVTSLRTWSDGPKGINVAERQPWFNLYQAPKLVVFGHWAKLEGVTRANVIGLDTGCVYGKRLTALILPERELVSVKAKQVYCPIKENDHQG